MEAASPSWRAQYEENVAPSLTATVVAAQMLAARESDAYVGDILRELDLGSRPAPIGNLVPEGFVGVSGDGLPVGTLLEQAVRHAGERYNSLRGESRQADLALAQQALDDTQEFVDGVIETILADTARAAEEAAMAQREWLVGWIRQAEPGACSRCIILSGRFYLFSEGFLRHPRCRCTHLPAPDDRSPDGRRARDALIAAESPESHFDALTEVEQDRVFGAAGAQAIRDGADIARVVNARRGMSTAQNGGRLRRVRLNGRDVYVTTEGTTRRGRTAGQVRGVRLMPESILEIANGDVGERIRLLRLHGYIT